MVVADSHSPRDGAFLKIIGHYNPLAEPAALVVKEEEAVYWLQKGAQPSETAAKLLTRIGVMERAGRQPVVYTPKEGGVKPKKQDPTLYKVVLLNDDYTTMEFVIHVLETVFQQSPAEAYRAMMQVHVNGRGIAGVYPWEVAETKVETVTSMAREAGFPLRAALEEA